MNLSACIKLPTQPLTGTWYRAIPPHCLTTSLKTAQTRSIPGRFNDGTAARPSFEVLYLAENPVVAQFERRALLGDWATPVTNPNIGAFLIINVRVLLTKVVDLTSKQAQSMLSISAQELTGDWRGYRTRTTTTSIKQPVGPSPTQQLGAALFAVRNLVGFQTISAQAPCYRCLVLFPEKIKKTVGNSVEFFFPETGTVARIAPEIRGRRQKS